MKKLSSLLAVFLTFAAFQLSAQIPVLVENQKLTVANLGGNNYTVGANSELRITTPVLANGTVNLTADSAWLILDNTLPSRAINLHLSYISVNGQPARNNINVRVTNYLRGCVIIPHTPTYEALTLFQGENYTGDEMKCIPYKYYKEVELGSFNNQVSSFKLKKGYMATFAQNQDGTGFSKVFIADKEDIMVSALQFALNNEVSFVRVFQWRYTEKKGMGWSNNAPIRALRGSWFFNWGPVTTDSKVDIEFVPTKYRASTSTEPSWKQILDLNDVSHLVGFNEPQSTGQANMTTEQQLEHWPKMMESGLRLGSPAPTDFDLFYKFMDECDKRNYRVDFVVLHDYGEGTAQSFYNFCKKAYDRTGRPIWVKEFNYGGTWTPGKPTYAQSAARIKEIIEMYDKEGIIERYAIFNFDESDQNRAVFYNPVADLNITPLGVVYRDQTSVMAFNSAEQIDIPFKMVAPININGTNTDGITTKLVWENSVDNSMGTFKIERSFNGGAFTEVATIEGTNSSYNDTVGATGFGVYTYRFTSLNAFMGNSAPVTKMVDVLASGKQNVARFKDVDVSLSHSAPFAGINAVDGNVVSLASRWVSKPNTFPAFIEIKLSDFYLVDELVMYCGSSGYNEALTNFNLQYWSNNKWIDAITETANTAAVYRKIFTEVRTDKVRLNIIASAGNAARLYEIELYGKEANTLGTAENTFYKNQFTIYPNPTTNTINIEGTPDVESVVIFDLNAKVLKKETGNKVVDVSQLAAGTYVIRINNKETLKFIKK